MGGLLDVSNKVPIKFNTNREFFTGTNWVHLTTIKNDYDAFTRTSSMMQVQFGQYNSVKQSILLLGISHSTICTPFVVALGTKDKGDVGLKLAYYYNSNDKTTSIYITTNLVNGAVGKIWVTKYATLNIINDDLSSIDKLPEDAVYVEP